LKLAFQDADKRLRPGMSAAARIAVGRLPDMLIVPTESVFIVDGRPSVYVLKGRKFVAVPVEIVRRGREQVAVKAALAAGDRVALTRPDEKGTGPAK
jgi:multidrug efflux pump subunit AcrA (membrane-fusion protein)